jgi:hypothetical protein
MIVLPLLLSLAYAAPAHPNAALETKPAILNNTPTFVENRGRPLMRKGPNANGKSEGKGKGKKEGSRSKIRADAAPVESIAALDSSPAIVNNTSTFVENRGRPLMRKGPKAKGKGKKGGSRSKSRSKSGSKIRSKSSRPSPRTGETTKIVINVITKSPSHVIVQKKGELDLEARGM